MIVLDTHTWLWWNSDPGKLSANAAAAVDSANELGLCPISCWELAMKVARGHLTRIEISGTGWHKRFRGLGPDFYQ